MINDFLGIAIVGAGLSAVIQYIKAVFGPSSNQTKLITLGLAIVLGGAYYLLRDTSMWQSILGILAAASTVYAFFIKD